MKKRIASIAMVMVLGVMCLTGCGKAKQVTDNCDYCDQKRPLYKVVATSGGKTFEDHVCKECGEKTKKIYDRLTSAGLDNSFEMTVYTGK